MIARMTDDVKSMEEGYRDDQEGIGREGK